MVGALALAGCGYSAGGLHGTEVKTIEVALCENLTFRRGLEVELTRALKSELRAHSDLRQVSGAAAESTLAATIVDVEERVSSEDDDDRVLEKRLTVTVDISWKKRDGTVLSEARVRASSDVAVGRGETLDFGSTSALRRVAERIVQIMEDASW